MTLKEKEAGINTESLKKTSENREELRQNPIDPTSGSCFVTRPILEAFLQGGSDMMIMKFHKLIQSRLLWLLFLGVLIMTFVGWGVAVNLGGDPAMERLEQPVGIVDGKEITFLKFDITRRLLANKMQQNIPDEILEEMAFTHLAMVAHAGKMGIDIPEEFARQQFALIFANESGEIDQAALENFRAGLRGSFMTENDYIRFIQEELMIQTLQNAFAASILIPEFDVDRWAGTQTDSYSIQFAPITNNVLEEDVVVSDEQLQSFFEENRERFRLPEERAARFIKVETEDFADQVEEVTESDVLDMYMSNPELYVRSVEKEAEEEGEEPTTVQETIPLDEVREQIKTEIRQERARKAAEEVAMSYAVRMTPRRGRSGMPMETFAESENLEMKTTGPFAQWGSPENLEDSFAFKQAVFDLDLSDIGKLGGPVEVGNDFVVVELVEIIPPRLPELEEVKERAVDSAQAFYTRKAIEARAEVIVENIRSGLDAGKSFEDLVKENNLNIVSPPSFELQSFNPNQSMLSAEMVQEVTSAEVGDVVGPTSSRFGIFVSYLAGRTPNPESAAELSPQIRQMLSQQLYFPEVFERFRKMEIEPLIEKMEEESGALDEDMTESEDAA